MKTIKNLDVQDIHQQIKSTKKFIKQTKESVEQVKQALNGVTALHDGFEGNTADSIRSFFEETHKPFLEFMNSFLIQYEETLSSVNEEVLSFESDEHGFIREEFLVDELKNRLVKASTSLTSTSIDINQQLLYVKDIVNIPSIDSEPFINSINKGKEKLSETLSNMYDMDANAAKKLDKPQQDIEQMKTYLAKIKDVIDKNNITVDSYSSEQLTKKNFYKDFKLQADGRQALTSDKPIPLTEQEYKALQDQIKASKTVQDDQFEWDGEYFTLEDGRIIRAYTDPNSDSAVSKMAFEFVSSIPENREDLKELKQEDSKKVVKDGTIGGFNYVFGDLITLADPNASLGEYSIALLFTTGKPFKAGKDVYEFGATSWKSWIDDLSDSTAAGKGLPDAKPGKVDEVKDSKGIGNAKDTKLTVDDIPTAKSGNFNKFFNSLTSSELDELWKDKKVRKKIERQLREPGGLHEWHLVSRAPQFKYWDISAEEIKDLRTAISDVKFINPNGVHGGLGSTKAHNELLAIIDTSSDYYTFVRRLNNWANYRLEGGVSSLPEGLRLE
ncbi:LXG domain-containing protein [Terribacillus sp. 179-K 1B1 HS]|uniref:T7SS effector LXG polymorphic toxin n=1 Tax=Terribacillus sp. 179-K 1B1 HS TaxID=3142388 RepID=UPI0039A3774C